MIYKYENKIQMGF